MNFASYHTKSLLQIDFLDLDRGLHVRGLYVRIFFLHIALKIRFNSKFSIKETFFIQIALEIRIIRTKK